MAGLHPRIVTISQYIPIEAISAAEGTQIINLSDESFTQLINGLAQVGTPPQGYQVGGIRARWNPLSALSGALTGFLTSGPSGLLGAVGGLLGVGGGGGGGTSPVDQARSALLGPGSSAQLQTSTFGGAVRGTFTDLDANDVVNQNGMPVVTNANTEERIRCPRGYVAVENPPGSGTRMCMLRNVAVSMGLWRAQPKAAVSAADMRTLKRAGSTAKKLEKIAAGSINIQNLKKNMAPKVRVKEVKVPVPVNQITNFDND